MPWMVFSEPLKTRPSGCGAMFTTKHPWPFQLMSDWRWFRANPSIVVWRFLHVIEHKYRWTPMMMEAVFVVWLQGFLKHAKAIILEDALLVLWSRHPRIQCW